MGVVAATVCLVLVGCQQEMAVQPGPRPYRTSNFFADGRADRPVVPGTVARGHLQTDSALFLGRRTRVARLENVRSAQYGTEAAMPNPRAWSYPPDDFVDEFPIPINERVIEHGYHRYMIYCVACHDPLGTGRGKIVERGYTQPPSYHIERLRKAPVGHLFTVIGEGYGSMPSYGPQIPPRDRWAIVAYLRALQLSQHVPKPEAEKIKRAAVGPSRETLAAGGRSP
jgi:hypothetical protein